MKRETGTNWYSESLQKIGYSSSISDVLARRVLETPRQPALWYKDSQNRWTSLNWKEYGDRLTGLAEAIERHGVEPGDRVAVIMPTSVEWELIEKAALSRGVVVVGLEPHMALETMVQVIEETRPSAVFVAERGMVETLRERGCDFLSMKLCVCLERCYDLGHPFVEWNMLEQKVVDLPKSTKVFSATADSPASYVLTSGTTGAPKGIVYTQGQLLLAAQSILAAMGPFQKDDRTIAWLPMASPFQRNMNLAALLAGIPLYFQSDPKQLMKTIKEVRPTVLIGVPRIYEKIYLGVLEKLNGTPLGVGRIMKSLLNVAMALVPRSSKEKDRLSWARRWILSLIRTLFAPVVKILGGQMRFMVTGSAPCREDVLLFFHALGVPLLEAYGVSECSVPISMNRPNDYKIGTVGRPLAANTVVVVDGGDLEVEGPGVFKGYENQERATNLTSEKYLSTGDIGEVDAEGYLRLMGRKSEFIKTSTGRKIAPAAIEQKLMRVLGAEQAMVVGQGRPFLAAIVCFNGPRTPEQMDELNRSLKNLNEGLSAYEQVRGCLVFNRLFSMEKGELTRTLKLRRGEIERMHRRLIEDLYQKKLESGFSLMLEVGTEQN
jgi:long-chain acyl-CoA synthetase